MNMELTDRPHPGPLPQERENLLSISRYLVIDESIPRWNDVSLSHLPRRCASTAGRMGEGGRRPGEGGCQRVSAVTSPALAAG
jgi:hypothetical protein